MRRRLTFILSVALIGLLLLLAQGVFAQSGGDYDVEWNVVGSAGDEFVAGGDYLIGFTLAQDQEPLISAGGDYQIAQGYWAGSGFHPTAVELLYFAVEARGDVLVALWETAGEFNTLGFNLYRSEGETYIQLNEGLIPAQAAGSPRGAIYEWVDAGAVQGQVYSYLLEDVDIYGYATGHGPVQGLLPQQGSVYLPLVYKGP